MERTENAEKQIAEMKPKSDYCNQVLDAEGLMTMTEIAAENIMDFSDIEYFIIIKNNKNINKELTKYE